MPHTIRSVISRSELIDIRDEGCFVKPPLVDPTVYTVLHGISVRMHNKRRYFEDAAKGRAYQVTGFRASYKEGNQALSEHQSFAPSELDRGLPDGTHTLSVEYENGSFGLPVKQDVVQR